MRVLVVSCFSYEMREGRLLLLGLFDGIRLWPVAMSGAGTELMSITHRLFTGVKIRGAAVGSVTLTSGGNEEALCACFGDGSRVCLTIIRSRLSVLSSVVGHITRGGVSPSGGVVRVVCAQLSTMGRIMCHGKALHTGFFQSV